MFKRIFRMLTGLLPKITMGCLMGAVDLDNPNICQCAMESD